MCAATVPTAAPSITNAAYLRSGRCLNLDNDDICMPSHQHTRSVAILWTLCYADFNCAIIAPPPTTPPGFSRPLFPPASRRDLGPVSYHAFEHATSGDHVCQQLVADLGPKSKTLLLRNHGCITVGNSVHEAFFRLMELIEACRVQVSDRRAYTPVAWLCACVCTVSMGHSAVQFGRRMPTLFCLWWEGRGWRDRCEVVPREALQRRCSLLMLKLTKQSSKVFAQHTLPTSFCLALSSSQIFMQLIF